MYVFNNNGLNENPIDLFDPLTFWLVASLNDHKIFMYLSCRIQIPYENYVSINWIRNELNLSCNSIFHLSGTVYVARSRGW